MTLPRSDTPLRRSAVGSYRESIVREMSVVNDDEAERREARRRTLLQQHRLPRDSSIAESIEDNETIRKCLEIYNGNKLSRDNAWSLSLIDTLSNLLDHHHKTLSNFKMAGSSLEASSKVYGLRVDSIYLDAMRMSAGLNARKLTEQQLNDADNDNADDMNVSKDANDPNSGEKSPHGAPQKSKKRARKAVSTVTKNKDTLNARLDTAPLQDPVFGKLNSTVGSINASNRLMHNILSTKDAELLLRTNYRFWDEEEILEDMDYTIFTCSKISATDPLVSAGWAHKLRAQEQQLKLRPLHTGYIITDAPNPTLANDTKPFNKSLMPSSDNDNHEDDNIDFYENPKELSMAFDINAECEPIPELDAHPAVLEVDFNDLEELTTEERTALNFCRNLRKQTVVIEDLRPVDGTSNLEYSYRPMDKISQFWAGPSHWKFKRTRARSTFGQANAQTTAAGSTTTGTANHRARRAQQQAAKRRSKLLKFGEFNEDLYQPLDATTKLRKANFQKKWDARKLMLPTKFSFLPNYFFKYDYAPGIKVSRHFGEIDAVQDYDDEGLDGHHGDAVEDAELFDNEHFTPDTPITPTNMFVSTMGNGEETHGEATLHSAQGNVRNSCNDTVLEIATDCEGAPTQVTKVIVPFAKRAKVIDMKNLKLSCNSLIQKQLLAEVTEASIPSHPAVKAEHYSSGVASFRDLYEKLPNLLTTKMADSLSPSVALYAVLHLANDLKLRLIPQKDLNDFKIRQVID